MTEKPNQLALISPGFSSQPFGGVLTPAYFPQRAVGWMTAQPTPLTLRRSGWSDLYSAVLEPQVLATGSFSISTAVRPLFGEDLSFDIYFHGAPSGEFSASQPPTISQIVENVVLEMAKPISPELGV